MKEIRLSDLKCVSENVDLDEYLTLYKTVKENMEHPEWLGDFSRIELEELLKDKIKIWIYYLNHEPVCSMMWMKATQKDIEKMDLDLDFETVAEYGPMMVHPKYVGNQLQYQMLLLMDQYSKQHGYLYIASTIHPDNVYSIHNAVKNNFEFVNQKVYKRGVRNIYLKKLDEIE